MTTSRDTTPCAGRDIAVATPGVRSAYGRFGMVSSPHELASAAGVATLRQGGNAIDAAIAASAALCVVTPHQCSLGGDAFWLVSAGREIVGYNGSGRSPGASDRETLLAAGLTAIPERSSLAVTVPGIVESWLRVHERYGSLEFDRLLGDAISYAGDGFPITPYFARQVEDASAVLKLRRESSRVYLAPGGMTPPIGHLLLQPDLARSLEEVAADPRALYRGSLARQVVDAVRSEDGVLTLGDLESHSGEWVTPIGTRWGSSEVLELPPNSQGITALIASAIYLAVKESVPPDLYLHAQIESMKLALEVRDEYIADPAVMAVSPMELLDSQRLARLVTRVGRTVAPTARPESASGDGGAPLGRGDTAHLAVVDADGNAVSLIQSVFADFGTGLIPPGTGIVLQNRGSYFSLDAQHVNRLRPGARTLHTLMPGMIAGADGAVSAVFGAMGGDGQAQTHLQILSRLLDDGAEPAVATSAPRWLVIRRDGQFVIQVEPGFSEAAIARLRELGHVVEQVGPYDESMGHAQIIVRTPPIMIGAADPRSDGAAIGW